MSLRLSYQHASKPEKIQNLLNKSYCMIVHIPTGYVLSWTMVSRWNDGTPITSMALGTACLSNINALGSKIKNTYWTCKESPCVSKLIPIFLETKNADRWFAEYLNAQLPTEHKRRSWFISSTYIQNRLNYETFEEWCSRDGHLMYIDATYAQVPVPTEHVLNLYGFNLDKLYQDLNINNITTKSNDDNISTS